MIETTLVNSQYGTLPLCLHAFPAVEAVPHRSAFEQPVINPDGDITNATVFTLTALFGILAAFDDTSGRNVTNNKPTLKMLMSEFFIYFFFSHFELDMMSLLNHTLSACVYKNHIATSGVDSCI